MTLLRAPAFRASLAVLAAAIAATATAACTQPTPAAAPGTQPQRAGAAPAPPVTAPPSAAEALPARAGAAGAPVDSPSPGAPLVVTWVVRSESPTELQLVARVEFRMHFADPLPVTVTVPPGVQIISGPTRFQAVAPPDFAPVEKAYIFAVGSGASGDILLAADLEGEGFGVHAKNVYAVGSPAGKRFEARAQRKQGPLLRVNGRDLGRSEPIGEK